MDFRASINNVKSDYKISISFDRAKQYYKYNLDKYWGMIRQEVMIEIIGADWQILAVEYSDLLGIADRYLYERLI